MAARALVSENGRASASRAGRPRDAAIDAAVTTTTWRLMQEVGYPGLSLDGIAAAARVSRPALKRRWSSKAALVVDTIIAHTPAWVAPDSGTLRGDLEGTLAEIERVWNQPGVRVSFAALVADLDDDPPARERFRALLKRRGESLQEAVTRARARGEVSRDFDPNVLADLVEGPLLHRRLISDAATTPDLVRAALDGALRYLTAEPRAAKRRRRKR